MSDPCPLVKSQVAAFRQEYRLAVFEGHKQRLLKILANARKGEARKVIFEAEGPWNALIRTATFYFWEEAALKNDPPNHRRMKSLMALKQKLTGMRALLLQNDVAIDLMRAIFQHQQSNTPSIAYPDTTQPLSELKISVVHLRKLEILASKAIAAVQLKGGRPKNSSTIGPEFIIRLAEIYRAATGRIPGAGEGPFASLLGAFLDAAGRRIAPDSVFGLIKRARKISLLEHQSGKANSPFAR